MSSSSRSSSSSSRPAWYLGNVDRSVAKKALLNRPDGCFIIRHSQTYPERLVLSYIYQGKTEQMLIFQQDSQFKFYHDNQSFTSLQKLVDACSDDSSPYPKLKTGLRPNIKLNSLRRSKRKRSKNDENLIIILEIEMPQATQVHLPACIKTKEFERDRTNTDKSLKGRLGEQHWVSQAIVDWTMEEEPLDSWTYIKVMEAFSDWGLNGLVDRVDTEVTGLALISLLEGRNDFLARRFSPREIKRIRKAMQRHGIEFHASNISREPSFRRLSSAKSASEPTEEVRSWDKFMVQNWMHAHDLDDFTEIFSEYDGILLLQVQQESISDLQEVSQSSKARFIYKLEKLKERARKEDEKLSPQIKARPFQVYNWNFDHVASWLSDIGFQDYTTSFRQHLINGRMLLLIDESALMNIGMTQPDHIQTFFDSLVELKETHDCEPSEPGSRASSSFIEDSDDGTIPMLSKTPPVFPSPYSVRGKPVSEWSSRDTASWISGLGYQDYAEIFFNRDVNGKQLLTLQDSDLIILGVQNRSHRRQILAKIRELADRTQPISKPKFTTIEPQPRKNLFGSGQGPPALATSSPLTKSSAFLAPQPSTPPSDLSHVELKETLVPQKSVLQWKPVEVSDWLNKNRFGQYANEFEAQNIDGERLLTLEFDDLEKLGMTNEKTKRNFLNAVDQRVRSTLPEESPPFLKKRRGRLQRLEALFKDAGDGPYETVIVSIQKNERGQVGFQFTGGEGSDYGPIPVITSVEAHGPSAKKLKIGDRLVRVNDRDLAEGTSSDIAKLLERQDTVILEIHRPIADDRSSTSTTTSTTIEPPSPALSFTRLRSTPGRTQSSSAAYPSPQRGFGRTYSFGSEKRTNSSNPAFWNNADVQNWLVNSQLHETAKAIKKKKSFQGPQLLTLNEPAVVDMKISHEEGVDLLRAVELLRSTVNAPFCVRWNSSQVQDWIEFHGLKHFSKPFSARKVDGPMLLYQISLKDLLDMGIVSMECDEFFQKRDQLHIRQSISTLDQLRALSAPEVGDILLIENFPPSLVTMLGRNHVSGSMLADWSSADLQKNLYSYGSKDASLAAKFSEWISNLRTVEDVPQGSDSNLPLQDFSDAVDWDISQVCDWLFIVGHGNLCQSFVDQNVNGQHLLRLDDNQLQALGVSPTTRVNLLQLLEDFKMRVSPAEQPPSFFAEPMWRWSKETVKQFLSDCFDDDLAELMMNVNQIQTGYDLSQLNRQSLQSTFHIDDALTRDEILNQIQQHLDLQKVPLLWKIHSWHPNDVGTWLDRCHLTEFRIPFESRGVDGKRMMNLTDSDLVQMGIKDKTLAEKFLKSRDHIVRRAQHVGREHIPVDWPCSVVCEWLIDVGLRELTGYINAMSVSGMFLLQLTSDELSWLCSDSHDLVAQLDREIQELLASNQTAASIVKTEKMHPQSHPAQQWGLSQVCDWLKSIGLEHLEHIFRRYSITGRSLLRINPDELTNMGVSSVNDRSIFFTQLSLLSKQRKSIEKVEPMAPDWFMLDASRADVETAQSLLKHGQFLVTKDNERNVLIIVYVYGQSIKNATIHYDDRSLVRKGYYLNDHPKSQQPTLQRMFKVLSKPNDFLECALDMPEDIDEKLSTVVLSSAKVVSPIRPLKQNRISWFQIGKTEDECQNLLQGTSSGSFVVCRMNDKFTLFYRNHSVVESIEIFMIHVKGQVAGFSFTSASTSGSSLSYCETIQELIESQSGQSRILKCSLNIDKMILLYNANNEGFSLHWSWCWIGYSPSQVKRHLRGLPEGAFIICDDDSDDKQSRSLCILYRCESTVEQERLLIRNGRWCLQSNPSDLFFDVESLLIACTKSKFTLACKLLTPSRAESTPRLKVLRLDSSVSRLTETSWTWWQLDSDGYEAEQLLSNKRTGAFVVYRDPMSTHRFILAYKDMRRIIRTAIHMTNKDNQVVQQGFYLEGDSRTYKTLQDLINAHMDDNARKLSDNPLSCPLYCPLPAPEGATVSQTSSPVKSRLFDRLQKATESGEGASFRSSQNS